MEILSSTFDHIHHISQVTGRRFPQHLVLMTDNTVAQAKKQHVFVFLALLVARRKFSTISLNFLMVGHTHEHIDQLFALFVEMVLRRHRFQSPKELAEAIDQEIGPVVREKGEECQVSEVKVVRGFHKWMSPHRCNAMEYYRQSWPGGWVVVGGGSSLLHLLGIRGHGLCSTMGSHKMPSATNTSHRVRGVQNP